MSLDNSFFMEFILIAYSISHIYCDTTIATKNVETHLSAVNVWLLILDLPWNFHFPFERLKRLFTTSIMNSFELLFRMTLLSVETLNYINLRFHRTVLQPHKYLHSVSLSSTFNYALSVSHSWLKLTGSIRSHVTKFRAKWNN